MTLTFDRRLTDSLTFEATARKVERLDRDPNSAALARDDAVIARLTLSF